MRDYSVAQIISSGGLYGAERVLLELAQFAAMQGWRSHVLLIDSPGAADVIAEARREGLPTALFSGSPLQVAGALRAHATEHNLQLIHSHGYRPDICVALARLGNRVRKVATCHTWYRESWKLKVYEWLDKLALRSFDRVVAVSPELQHEIIDAGIDRRLVSLIHNGMDFTAAGAQAGARVRAELGIGAHERVLLRLGRLAVAKGNDILLQAAATLPATLPYRVVLAGEGEDRQRLESMVHDLGLRDRVLFTGFRKDVGDLLAASDVFVISSLKEGLPMVLLEAMAARTPIVTTAVGAIPEVIEHGNTGLLVAPGDPRALGDAIAEVLNQPAYARDLAERAYQRYEQHHSRAAMGRQYIALYESLLQGAPQ